MNIFQMTGLSGAGKTSIATLTAERLSSLGITTEVIDGDTYRKTVCKDLGFSKHDRCENIRRLGVIAYDFAKVTQVVIISAINPFKDVRDELNFKYGAKVIYIECSMDTLVKRDTKGLYKLALLPDSDSRKLKNLTGVNDEYQPPIKPDLILNTNNFTIEESTQDLISYIKCCLQLPKNITI